MFNPNSITQSDIKNKITEHESKILQANSAYSKDGNHSYFVNECFKYNDVVLPINMVGEQTTESDQTRKMKDLIDKIDNMSMSTMHSDKDSRRNSIDVGTDYSNVMIKRWESHVQTLPSLD